MKRECANCFKSELGLGKNGYPNQTTPCRDCKRRQSLKDYHATKAEKEQVRNMRGYYG